LKLRPKLLQDSEARHAGGFQYVSTLGDWKPEKEFIVPDTEVDSYLKPSAVLMDCPGTVWKVIVRGEVHQSQIIDEP